MPSFKDTLELILHADSSGAISELKKFSSETETQVKKSESSLQRLSSGALKIGAGGMGVGALLTSLGDEATAATQQLDAAISAAGQSAEEYKGKIDAAISSDEKFGHTAHETETALTTLVGSYGDTETALDRMTLVENLAAAKHIDLASAAEIVAKAHGGAGRIFKEFNIQVQTNADGTKNYEGALDTLSQKVSGQASASMAGLTGWLKATGAAVEDDAAAFAQKYGPAILGVSTGLTALGGVGTGVSSVLKNVSTNVGGLGAALMTAGPLVLPLAAALPLVAFGVEESGKRAKQAATEVDAYAAALANTNGKVEDNVRLATAQNIANSAQQETIKKSGADLRLLADEVTNGTDKFDAFRESVLGTSTNTAQFSQVIKSAKDSTDPFVRSLVDAYNQGKITGAELQVIVREVLNLQDGYGDAKGKSDALKTSTDALGGATDTTTQSIVDEKKAIDDARDAVKKLDDTYRGIVDSTLDSFTAAIKFSNAQIATRDSIDKLNKAQQDGTKTADELSKSQNDVFDAILAQAKAAEDNADAQAKANGKTLDARDAQQAVKEELWKVADTLAPGSELRKRVEDYISQLDNDIPGKVNTKIQIDADKALTDLARVLEYVNNIKNGVQDFAGPGLNVTPPGYVPTPTNPLEGLPPGLNLPPLQTTPNPRITAAFGQAPVTMHFAPGAIVSTDPKIIPQQIGQYHMAASIMGN